MINKEIKSLKNIIGDSNWYVLSVLWFFLSLFAFSGIDGNYYISVWLLSFVSICVLFKTAMNASEVGL